MLSAKFDPFKPYIFIVPALILFATFSIYPFFLLTATSFLEWDGVFPANPFGSLQSYAQQFVSVRNYVEVLRDGVFWNSFAQAGYVTILALTFQNALALLLAIAVNRKLAGGSIYRTIFFIPPILSEIVVGLIWYWIYDGNFGILNQWLTGLGLTGWTRPWLADKDTALTAVAIIHMWKGFGWGFVMFLAGLQTIPEELYEAARVDGANAWYRFRHITLPLLVPVCVVVSILTILGTMQIFALIFATTRGGPGYHTDVPITRIYSNVIDAGRFGYGCAQGIVFGLILLAFSLLQMRLQRRAT